MKNMFSGHNFGKLSNESIKIISNCPACDLPYNSLEAKILKENGQSHLLYIKCRHCLSSLIALITFSAYGISSLGLITDLSGQEISRHQEESPLTSEELLESYSLLKNGESLAALLTKNDF